MQIKIEFTAKLPCKITRRKKWILASCPILDVHTQGATENQAKKNLAEALSLFLISCFERGSLDALLKQCGFKTIQPTAAHKQSLPKVSENYVNVPLPFVVNAMKTGHSCHA